jgi:maltose alpha-D-glucosyltransferase/alpha-amylase
VLWTGTDFVIIDFEGEPARSLTERRLKRSAFKDIAGMIRSFHYAAYAQLGPTPDPELERRAIGWYRAVSAAFLRSYFETAAGSVFLPNDRAQRELLLRIFLLEKAVYELGYELDNRPEWIHIPIYGIRTLIEETNNRRQA